MRFGRLLVLEPAKQPSRRSPLWVCRCDCGNITNCTSAELRYGHTKSCGCWKSYIARILKLTHGMSKTPTYLCWSSMFQRCLNRNRNSYKDYGGRGITVCERWKSFENFLADMGEKPADKTIGRINNDGNYEPSNCHWETIKEQCRNRRNTVYVELNGVRKSLPEWSDEIGIHRDILHNRILHGFPAELVLFKGNLRFRNKCA